MANNNGRLLFKPDTPHFFKIFHGSSINLDKLAIPRKFARFYGRDLQSSVVLKVPAGSKWQVEIVRSSGGIWLQNGWQEFAEYYSVVDGSMLVFEYEKSASEFSVIIFDKTTTEINYPFEDVVDDQDQVPREPNVVVDEAERDVSVEISPSNANLDEQSQKVKTFATKLNQNGQAKGRSRRVKKSSFTRKKTLSEAEKAKAVHRAMSTFRSQNPSFKIVMQPSYVHNGNVPVIPLSFVRKYLKKNGDAILNIVDGKSWSVKYYSSTSSRGKAQTKFSNPGWINFVKDNDLQVGDACIFEHLLQYVDETTKFRVTISQYSDLFTSPGDNSKQSKQPKGSSDSLKRPRLPRTCNVRGENQTRKKIKLDVGDCPYKEQVEVGFRGSKKTKASDKGKQKAIGTPRSNFSSGNPTFERDMKPSNFFYNNKYFLRVPRNFVKNTEQKSQKLKLQVNGNKLWSVTLNIYPCIGIFGKGWFEFARENSLEAGDVCTFELINTEKLLVRVSIARNVS